MADGGARKRRQSQVATAGILRLFLASGLSVGALTALAAAGACLPDLTAIADADASSDDAGVTALCGNGVIDTTTDGGGEQCDPGDLAADAQASGCRDCRITCEGLPDPETNHCYFAAGTDTKYADALARCLRVGAHVVTIDSEDEQSFVRRLAADESGYWVGLVLDSATGAYRPSRLEEPGFPYTPRSGFATTGPCEGCFSVGADAGVLPIADVDASDLSCVALRADGDAGRWFQVPCTPSPPVGRPTVCEREPDGLRSLVDCPIGAYCFDVAATYGKKRYFIFNAAVDPDVAAQSCAAVERGTLALIASREEREQVAHEVLAHSPETIEQQLWIGLSSDGGAWTWDDGIPATQRPSVWGNAQPSDGGGPRAYLRISSTAYDTQLAYADDNSRASRLYICERPTN